MTISQTKPYTIKVCRIGDPHSPIYIDHFMATRRQAENRLSDAWGHNTPPDGTRYRAVLYERGGPQGRDVRVQSIGGR